jgi:hypothetical protein
MTVKLLKDAVRVTLLLVFLLLAAAAGAQTVLIDDSFDFDVKGWDYFGGPKSS